MHTQEYVCDAQLAGKGIFQHTGASLVMAQLNDSSFIAEHIWTVPVSSPIDYRDYVKWIGNGSP